MFFNQIDDCIYLSSISMEVLIYRACIIDVHGHSGDHITMKPALDAIHKFGHRSEAFLNKEMVYEIQFHTKQLILTIILRFFI